MVLVDIEAAIILRVLGLAVQVAEVLVIVVVGYLRFPAVVPSDLDL
jgi:hypothetical protein